MWKRSEQEQASETESGAPPGAAPSGPTRSSPPPSTSDTNVAKIGQSVVVKGELTGSENLVIDGTIEGTINLREHQLTIGPGGQIAAEILANAVVVLGRVEGNITAAEKIEIREDGAVDGDLTAPRVSIAEGSHFRGSIDMQRSKKSEPAGQRVTPPPGDDPDGAARVAAPSGSPPRSQRSRGRSGG